MLPPTDLHSSQHLAGKASLIIFSFGVVISVYSVLSIVFMETGNERLCSLSEG